MRIGQLAAQAGVRTTTIRFYERVGLLGQADRTPSGYRDYDGSALDRLAFVRAGQSAGLTLGELREVVALRDRGQVPCAHVARLLDHKAHEVATRITELRRLEGQLQTLRDRARRLDPRDCQPSRICHIIGPGLTR